MALIVPSGGLVSQVNGKCDNKVYYRGRWGNVVRNWVNPTNTITPERTDIRNLFASLVSLYNSLTEDMQNEWDYFASKLVMFNRLAQPYVPTGIQVFIQRNMNLAIGIWGPLLLPPEDEPILAVTSWFCYFANTTGFLVDGTLSNGLNVFFDPYFAVIYATNMTPPGQLSKTNRYRIIKVIQAAASINIDALPGWTGAWTPSTPVTGQRVFFKIVLINHLSGQACKPTFCSKILS